MANIQYQELVRLTWQIKSSLARIAARSSRSPRASKNFIGPRGSAPRAAVRHAAQPAKPRAMPVVAMAVGAATAAAATVASGRCIRLFAPTVASRRKFPSSHAAIAPFTALTASAAWVVAAAPAAVDTAVAVVPAAAVMAAVAPVVAPTAIAAGATKHWPEPPKSTGLGGPFLYLMMSGLRNASEVVFLLKTHYNCYADSRHLLTT